MANARQFATETLLRGGIVLVAGGAAAITALTSAELYKSDGMFANGFQTP